MTPRKEYHRIFYDYVLSLAPVLDVSEEDNSLSSPGPLSPPSNNKRIDSYFAPKEVVRTDSKSSISRSLFGKSIADTHSTQGVDVLQTPPQSVDNYPPLPNRVSLLPTVVPTGPTSSGGTLDGLTHEELSSQPSMLDQRSKDVYNLLMSKDTRIKELEHVHEYPHGYM